MYSTLLIADDEKLMNFTGKITFILGAIKQKMMCDWLPDSWCESHEPVTNSTLMILHGDRHRLLSGGRLLKARAAWEVRGVWSSYCVQQRESAAGRGDARRGFWERRLFVLCPGDGARRGFWEGRLFFLCLGEGARRGFWEGQSFILCLGKGACRGFWRDASLSVAGRLGSVWIYGKNGEDVLFWEEIRVKLWRTAERGSDKVD